MRLFRSSWAMAFSLASLAACLAACGGDDGGGSSEGGSGQTEGGAPTLSALTFSPDTIPVGAATAVTIQFQFEDAEGDAKTVRIALTQAGLQPSESTVDLQGAAGAKSGPGGVVLTLTPPLAGELEFSLTVIDAAKHTSNALTGVIHVVEVDTTTASSSVSTSDASVSSSVSSGTGGSGGAGSGTGGTGGTGVGGA